MAEITMFKPISRLSTRLVQPSNKVRIEFIIEEKNNYVKYKKFRIKLFILLGIIWIVLSLPLPWVINNPNITDSAFFIVLGLVGIMSIPFVILGIVWSLKPELTT